MKVLEVQFIYEGDTLWLVYVKAVVFLSAGNRALLVCGYSAACCFNRLCYDFRNN